MNPKEQNNNQNNYEDDEEWDNCTDSDIEEDLKEQFFHKDNQVNPDSNQQEGPSYQSSHYHKKRQNPPNPKSNQDYNQNYPSEKNSHQSYQYKDSSYGGYQDDTNYHYGKPKRYQDQDRYSNNYNKKYNDSNYVSQTERSMNSNTGFRQDNDFVNTNSNFAKKADSKRAQNYHQSKNNYTQHKGYYNEGNEKKPEEVIAKPMFINSKLGSNQEEHFIALEQNPHPEEIPKLNLIPSNELVSKDKVNEEPYYKNQFERKYNQPSGDQTNSYSSSNISVNNSSSSYYQKYNRYSKGGSHNIYQPEHGFHQSSKNSHRSKNDMSNKYSSHGGEKRYGGY